MDGENGRGTKKEGGSGEPPSLRGRRRQSERTHHPTALAPSQRRVLPRSLFAEDVPTASTPKQSNVSCVEHCNTIVRPRPAVRAVPFQGTWCVTAGCDHLFSAARIFLLRSTPQR